jgi:hypothetical protein
MLKMLVLSNPAKQMSSGYNAVQSGTRFTYISLKHTASILSLKCNPHK